MRWHIRACTRCRTTLEPGDYVRGLTLTAYQPTLDGPDWEAIGDWALGRQLGAVLCRPCVDALTQWLYAMQAPGAGHHPDGRTRHPSAG